MACFNIPWMPDGCMVKYQVHDHADVPFFCFCKQILKVVKIAKTGVDAVKIACIIAIVFVWRRLKRREPDHADPKLIQVIEFAYQTFEISCTVTMHLAPVIAAFSN